MTQNPIKWETPNCLICDSGDNEPYLQIPNRFNWNESFQLVRCRYCHFVYLSPRPSSDSISNYYKEDGYQPHQTEARGVTEKIYQGVRVRNNRRKRKLIEKIKSTGRLMDYGCGTGEFLKEMKDSGWETIGFEPAEKAAEMVKRHGIKLIESLDQIPSDLDIITLWHVLEHLHHPKELLRQFHRKLSSSGYLFIAVPNYLSFDARIFKQNWVAYDAPRHLYHFNPKDMISFLTPLNFQLISKRQLLFDPWFNALFSATLDARGKKGKLVARSLPRALITAVMASIQGLTNRNLASSIIYLVKPIKD